MTVGPSLLAYISRLLDHFVLLLVPNGKDSVVLFEAAAEAGAFSTDGRNAVHISGDNGFAKSCEEVSSVPGFSTRSVHPFASCSAEVDRTVFGLL